MPRRKTVTRERNRGSLGLALEIDAWRLGELLFVLHREGRLRLEAEHHGGQVARKRAHRDVVFLYRLDIAVARHRDAVFRALELRLQVAEQRIGLELRV